MILFAISIVCLFSASNEKSLYPILNPLCHDYLGSILVMASHHIHQETNASDAIKISVYQETMSLPNIKILPILLLLLLLSIGKEKADAIFIDESPSGFVRWPPKQLG